MAFTKIFLGLILTLTVSIALNFLSVVLVWIVFEKAFTKNTIKSDIKRNKWWQSRTEFTIPWRWPYVLCGFYRELYTFYLFHFWDIRKAFACLFDQLLNTHIANFFDKHLRGNFFTRIVGSNLLKALQCPKMASFFLIDIWSQKWYMD